MRHADVDRSKFPYELEIKDTGSGLEEWAWLEWCDDQFGEDNWTFAVKWTGGKKPRERPFISEPRMTSCCSR